MRTCKKCLIPKDESAFLGKMYTCKECQREINIEKSKKKKAPRVVKEKVAKEKIVKPKAVKQKEAPVVIMARKQPIQTGPRTKVVRRNWDKCLIEIKRRVREYEEKQLQNETKI